MNIKDYNQQALQTRIYPNVGNNYAYCLFGLVGESGELLEKSFSETEEFNLQDVIKELGDNTWYVVGLADELKLSERFLNSSFNANKSAEDLEKMQADYHVSLVRLPILIGTIGEIVKKAIRDNNGVIPEAKLEVIYNVLVEYWNQLILISNILGYKIEEVCQINIDKLTKRAVEGKISGSGDNR
mgnify:CR=1 FL=1